jgi:hypothetical protein
MDAMQPRADEEGAAPAGGATAAVAVAPAPPAPWSTGLFDCFDDVGNCEDTAKHTRERASCSISRLIDAVCMQRVSLIDRSYIYVQAA